MNIVWKAAPPERLIHSPLGLPSSFLLFLLTLLENVEHSEPPPLLIDVCVALGKCWSLVRQLGGSFWTPGLLPLGCCQPLGFCLPFWHNFSITWPIAGDTCLPCLLFCTKVWVFWSYPALKVFLTSHPVGCPRVSSCLFPCSGPFPELLCAAISFRAV